jgi:hypothetical protein
MKTVILLFALVCVGNAGIIRVVTYPVRHPVKVIKKTGHIIKVVVW